MINPLSHIQVANHIQIEVAVTMHKLQVPDMVRNNKIHSTAKIQGVAMLVLDLTPLTLVLKELVQVTSREVDQPRTDKQ